MINPTERSDIHVFNCYLCRVSFLLNCYVCSTKIGENSDISKCFENFVFQILGVLTRIYAAELRLYMKKVYIVTIMLFLVLSCRQTYPCTREYLIANFQNNEKYFSMLIDFYNSHDIVNNKEEQFVFTLNRCKDDVDIDIIPYIIDDKKKQISLSNIRANFERCKNILSTYNINIRKSDIASVINCLKSINCRMVRNTNYYSGQIEFIPSLIPQHYYKLNFLST